MKKIIKLIILLTSLSFSVKQTIAFYNTSDRVVSNFSSTDYAIRIDANGGFFNSPNIIVKNNTTILPTPTKSGYKFLGFSSTSEGDLIYSTDIKCVTEINNKSLYARWELVNYSITYDLAGGTVSTPPANYNIESTLNLPQPQKTGYTFAGWLGTGLNSPTKNVTISKETGNKNFTATWEKNYYNVNYYVNSNLWAQRKVGYGDAIENLNAQATLDSYHTFHGWTNWVSNMPDHSIDLYANVTEAYCNLSTGHGPYGNASALLQVFQSAGWSGNIIEAATAPGNYMVVTDYNLTRAQAESQKNYIAQHTNYNNYNYPYLYWVSINCSNGYGQAWTRPRGQLNFN